MANNCLNTITVQNRSPDSVVLKASHQAAVEPGFFSVDAVNDTLVKISALQTPNLTGEHDVVTVMHLREVIERSRLFWKRQCVAAAIVNDFYKSLFNIDVGGS